MIDCIALLEIEIVFYLFYWFHWCHMQPYPQLSERNMKCYYKCESSKRFQMFSHFCYLKRFISSILFAIMVRKKGRIDLIRGAMVYIQLKELTK